MIILAQFAVLKVKLLSSISLTFNFVLNAEIALKSESSCHLSSGPFALEDWCLYMQHNTHYLVMFTLCVTSTCDKFPILLHWLYIYVHIHFNIDELCLCANGICRTLHPYLYY